MKSPRLLLRHVCFNRQTMKRFTNIWFVLITTLFIVNRVSFVVSSINAVPLQEILRNRWMTIQVSEKNTNIENPAVRRWFGNNDIKKSNNITSSSTSSVGIQNDNNKNTRRKRKLVLKKEQQDDNQDVGITKTNRSSFLFRRGKRRHSTVSNTTLNNEKSDNILKQNNNNSQGIHNNHSHDETLSLKEEYTKKRMVDYPNPFLLYNNNALSSSSLETSKNNIKTETRNSTTSGTGFFGQKKKIKDIVTNEEEGNNNTSDSVSSARSQPTTSVDNNFNGTTKILSQDSMETSDSDANISLNGNNHQMINETDTDETNSTETISASNNSTTEDEEMNKTVDETNQQLSTQMPPGVIFVGPMNDMPSRYQRKLQPGNQPPQQQNFLFPQQYQLHQQQQEQQRQLQQHQQQNSMMIMEVLASIIGTGIRLFFLTWIARSLASQEQFVTPNQHFVYERMNDRYIRDMSALRKVLDMPPSQMTSYQWKHHQRKFQNVNQRALNFQPDMDGTTFNRTVLVLELSADNNGNIDVSYFKDVVTFILYQYKTYAFGVRRDRINKNHIRRQNNVQQQAPIPLEVEVVILLKSPGGSVTTYGLAAAQLQRLRDSNMITNNHNVTSALNGTDILVESHHNAIESRIKVTVCVDEYAASGGYMIASQADYLIAAPFATVGSVGVIMEGLNFNEIAKRYGITPLILKAGSSKNPLTTWGPVTNKELDSESKRLDKVHIAFQQYVLHGRPQILNQTNDDNDSTSLTKVQNTILDGSVFLGIEALKLKLIDSVQTSDEYLISKILLGDRVLKIHRSSEYRIMRRNISPLDILPHLRRWSMKIFRNVIQQL